MNSAHLGALLAQTALLTFSWILSGIGSASFSPGCSRTVGALGHFPVALLNAKVASQVKMLFAHLLCPSLFLKEGLDSPIRTGNYVSISLLLFCTPGAGAEDVAEFVPKVPLLTLWTCSKRPVYNLELSSLLLYLPKNLLVDSPLLIVPGAPVGL